MNGSIVSARSPLGARARGRVSAMGLAKSALKTRPSLGRVWCFSRQAARSTGSAAAARVVFFSRQSARLHATTARAVAARAARGLLPLCAQFLKPRVRRFRHPVGQDPQGWFGQFRARSATVGHRRAVAARALLAQQFINEGCVDSEQRGECSLGTDSPFDCINSPFS